MFSKIVLCLFICTSSFYISGSSFVDNIQKCSIKDSKCLTNLLQTILRDIAKTGIPESSIPPIDPFYFKNVSVEALGLVEVTLVDGVAKGVKGCVVNKFEANIENNVATMELTCDLTIKGKYVANASSPIIQNVLGGTTIHGEGKTKVVIDKMHMTFNYHFLVTKRDDGEIYIDSRHDDLKYTYDVGKMTFAANNLYLGETEASGLIMNMMNQNWKMIMQNAGRPFLDKAMDIIYEQSHKFFDKIPTKYFLTDDMSQYLTEE